MYNVHSCFLYAFIALYLCPSLCLCVSIVQLGGGVEVKPSTGQLAEMARDWPEINHLYMIENYLRRLVPGDVGSQCDLSLTLTNTGAIMLVLEAINTRHSTACQAAAMEVALKINKPSSQGGSLRPLTRTARLLPGMIGNSIKQSVRGQVNTVTSDLTRAKSMGANKVVNSYNSKVKGVENYANKKQTSNSGSSLTPVMTLLLLAPLAAHLLLLH